MTPRILRWAAALCIAAALPAAAVRGEEPWWVVKPHKATAAAPPAAPAPAVTLGRPIPLASLDRPVAVPEAAWNPQATPPGGGWNPPAPPAAGSGWNTPTTAPVSFAPPSVEDAALPAGYDEAPGGLMAPRVARGQPADPAPPGALVGPPPTAPADGGYNTGAAVDQPLHHGFMDGCREWFNFGARPSTCCTEWFKSDHFCDDSLISPVSNPFYFEDPRSLTEIRPLFIIEKAPKANGGGNAEFYGVQGRLSLTEQWSLVVNKLGFVSLNPAVDIDGYHKATGFAEFNFGPKFTFWRDEALRNVAAVGLNVEAPIGSKTVFQDTGTLGLDPYITYGQSFGRTSFGSFNFLGEAGYSFAVDNERSEFFHGSLHLDYDVLSAHRFFPLLEMNWFHYTKSGNNSDLGFEGTDLVNFGSSTLGGRDLVTIAPGMRYKFNEWAQVGGAVEFPVTKQKDLQDFRVTLDLIFRY